MLDGISQSLVNMASKVGKGDLDKGVRSGVGVPDSGPQRQL